MINQPPKIRDEMYEIKFDKWNQVEPDEIETHIDKWYFVYGMAGIGTSTKLNKVKRTLIKNNAIT